MLKVFIVLSIITPYIILLVLTFKLCLILKEYVEVRLIAIEEMLESIEEKLEKINDNS